MSFATTGMDPEMIILSEVSQTGKHCMILLTYEILKKIIQMKFLQNRNRPTDIENKLMVTEGKRWGRDKLGVRD